jgi:hypothetical protein
MILVMHRRRMRHQRQLSTRLRQQRKAMTQRISPQVPSLKIAIFSTLKAK